MTYGYVQVSLTQRQGQSLIQGSNAVDLTSCDGIPQTYQVQITGNGPFKAGAAVASGYTYACDAAYNCTSAQAGKAIQISR